MQRREWNALMVAMVAVAFVPGASRAAEQTDGRRNGAGVIEVWKGDRRMQLREGDAVLREFAITLGKQPESTKLMHGDSRTPEGRYYVSEKRSKSRFRRFLGINYPNLVDAERGYREGLIDAGQWADIYFSNVHGKMPPSGTRLGGRVGIHGYGGRPAVFFDWTQGCIAISDEAIDYLYERVLVGTPVIIHQ